MKRQDLLDMAKAYIARIDVLNARAKEAISVESTNNYLLRASIMQDQASAFTWLVEEMDKK